jgi:hypothetical protein
MAATAGIDTGIFLRVSQVSKQEMENFGRNSKTNESTVGN